MLLTVKYFSHDFRFSTTNPFIIKHRNPENYFPNYKKRTDENHWFNELLLQFCSYRFFYFEISV